MRVAPGALSFDSLVISFSLGLAERNPLLIATVIAIFSASIGSGVLLIALAGAAGWL